MATRASSIAPEAEILDALLRALAAADEPMTAAALHRGLKGCVRCSESRARTILQGQAELGRIFQFAPYFGKAPRYWHADLATYAEQAMLRVLEKPQSATALEQSLAKRLADLSKAQRQGLLNRLVEEGRALAHPKLPGGKACKYCVHPPDPRDYLRAAIARLRKQIDQTGSRLAPLGVSTEQLFAAAIELLGGSPAAGSDVGRIANPSGCQVDFRDGLPIRPTAKPALGSSPCLGGPNTASVCPAEDFAAAFDTAFGRLDRRDGSHNFVSLVDLRRALDAWPREAFDGGLRGLRVDGRFDLAGAENLGGLRAEEREAGILEAGSLLLYVSRKQP
ncbi:MAG: hypothetical protein ACLQNE_21280 [Thermoguttaceae bacterium]